ncbi:hypothetical protein Tco_0788042 [Tanacetum coccineum]
MTLYELTILCTKLSNKVKEVRAVLFKDKQARRRTKIVVSDDEEDEEDPSKQGRSYLEEMNKMRMLFSYSYTEQEAKFNAKQEELLASETTKDDRNAEWDDVLARVAADEDFVQKCSEEDLPMKLVELFNQRKKFFAQQRAEAKTSKPMTSAQQKDYMSNYIKNKKELEVQRLKRVGQEVLEEPVKIQKIGEASVEEVYVEALQVKYPIIDWEVYSEDIRKYWKIIRERFSTTEPTDDKEKELWVELKRLLEPDNDDTLWKLQRYMHESLVWRLYDTCGVHHEMLSRMLNRRLEVDHESEMAFELLRFTRSQLQK